MRDIDTIIERIRGSYPDVAVAQLQVKHPVADDDGLWFFAWSGCPFEVQIESSDGMCPFVIETDEHDRRITAGTTEGVVQTLLQCLHLDDSAV